MKLSITFLSTLIAVVFFTSCGDGGQAEREKLRDEVMALHDEVMPKMGDLRKTRKSLEALADSLAMDSLQAAQAQEFRAIAKEIGDANESMMAWMRQYEPSVMEDGTPHGEVMAYLKEQKEAIVKVKQDMIESLSKGTEAIK
ncbi:MAG: hypothetical protein RIF33_00545 [Cyclobacteriaceae bacterium]